MYYYLKGELVYSEPGICVIDCGGVGYQLTVSLYTTERLRGKENQTVMLFTHLAVREDGIELFGFGSKEERESFHRLTSVSGIGPKAAMSILSTLTPDRLALAICTEDIKGISKAPGIGAKTAARIVLELRDKVSKDMLSSDLSSVHKTAPAASPRMSGKLSDATEALMSLGYDKNSVLNAIRGIDTEKIEVGEIIRLALKKLS